MIESSATHDRAGCAKAGMHDSMVPCVPTEEAISARTDQARRA